MNVAERAEYITQLLADRDHARRIALCLSYETQWVTAGQAAEYVRRLVHEEMDRLARQSDPDCVIGRECGEGS